MKFIENVFIIVKLRTILLDPKHVSPLLTLIIIIIKILIKPWKYINLLISMDIYTLILFSLIFVMNKKWKIRFFSWILATKLKFITWLYFGNKNWFGLKNKNKNVDIGCSLPLKFWGPYIWLFHKEAANICCIIIYLNWGIPWSSSIYYYKENCIPTSYFQGCSTLQVVLGPFHYNIFCCQMNPRLHYPTMTTFPTFDIKINVI